MADVWWSFSACGWTSWLTLLTALGAMAFAAITLAAVLFRARAGALMSWVALAISLLPIGAGAAGMAVGRSRVNQAIAGGLLDPSQLARIREQGYREAGSCVTLGVSFAAVPLLLALGALGAAYALGRRTLEAGADSDRG